MIFGSSLGIDFGTSGARALVIDTEGRILAQTSLSNIEQSSEGWQSSLFQLIEQIPLSIRCTLQSIAINGTSSSVLMCDRTGSPITAPLLYHDDRGKAVLDQIQSIAPAHHTVLSSTSSLAKLLWWIEQGILEQAEGSYFLHQADWLSFLLHGRLGISDYHNALKLGYDVERLRYPDWLLHLQTQLPQVQLPQVLAPGTPITSIRPHLATQWQLPPECLICAGTTDSIAAFLASGAQFPGEAVTSLGSTLVLKLLSQKRVEDARYGIYSHRLGELWLVGGASNTGGAVLRHFFSDAELQALSAQIQSHYPSPLDYYPLIQPGERFPVNDPDLLPRLAPRPAEPSAFLHGLLESMARIETKGYKLLQTLGATQLQQIYTAGGGAKNLAWTQIRSRHLQVPVQASVQTEAAYGSALLAQRGIGQSHVQS